MSLEPCPRLDCFVTLPHPNHGLPSCLSHLVYVMDVLLNEKFSIILCRSGSSDQLKVTEVMGEGQYSFSLPMQIL